MRDSVGTVGAFSLWMMYQAMGIADLLVQSPITGCSNVTFVHKIDCAWLVRQYREILGIDISRLVREHREIVLYKCNDSGYRFYYPTDVVGDSWFYHQLESNDWYYLPRKWEFDEARRFIEPGSSVLEIGAGRGHFVEFIVREFPGISCVGLDPNEYAAREAHRRGVEILVESLREHARKNPRKYHVACCFQTLEHVPKPMDYLQDMLSILRPGGLLVIGVPDNSDRPMRSIFVTPNNILNMPPHHQGLWDVVSLAYLAKVLPVKLEHLAVEPASARHHFNSYRGLMKADLLGRFGRILGQLVYLAGRPFYNHALRHLCHYLPAHSILAVYRKV